MQSLQFYWVKIHEMLQRIVDDPPTGTDYRARLAVAAIEITEVEDLTWFHDSIKANNIHSFMGTILRII